ncbi:GTP-binding protein 10 [Harmonia axyridis]|uniref:GTP-binding protein 10 n=1 Tax=Harmonia axyridis TaxID=115357 RepID=UPI001E2755CA|nr:GTP-binding protein 10 [Harmonia axyridis]
MIVKTPIMFAKRRKLMRNFLKVGFKDSLNIFVSGGCGGNGLPKFGGIGGFGGNVSVIAKEGISLDQVYKQNKSLRFIAGNGGNSSANCLRGAQGEDIKLEVPVGVSLVTELGKKLGELDKENEELIIAKGGTPGHSKNGYLGTEGQAYPVKLDLKLIADIGLVGFPNAGKSSLLSAISHAKPKVANYPFTTVRPHLGMIHYPDHRQISMADLPGLIEGAHTNRGMGHKFLKHVERTKLLLLVVDIHGFQLGPQYPFRTCLDTVLLLNKELELYKPELIDKPSLIIINKMDVEGAEEKYNQIKEDLKNLSRIDCEEDIRSEKFLKFRDILPVSVKNRAEDIALIKEKLRKQLDVIADEEANDESSLDLYQDMREKNKERGPKLV